MWRPRLWANLGNYSSGKNNSKAYLGYEWTEYAIQESVFAISLHGSKQDTFIPSVLNNIQ